MQRREDPALVQGAGTYLDDVRPEGALHLAVVRSPLAHALLGQIEAEEARRAPGVHLVLTPPDVADVKMPPRPDPDKRIPRRFPLVQDRARMSGDPVAGVVAETPEQARDAADLVFVDYQPLPVVGDPEESLQVDPLYPEYGDNLAYQRSKGDRDAVETPEGAIILEGTVDHPRLVPNPLETRGCVARWEGDRLTLHLSSQAPHLMAEELAWAFDLPSDRVRVITPFVGGGFGCKFDLAEEEVLAVVAARRLGRPVKWMETRQEHFLAIGHGRAQRHHYRVVADRHGKVLGLWIDAIVDVGARRRYLSGAPVTPRMGTGNYDIPRYAWRQRGVFTNRAPTGIYRGAGRPEATLTLERIMDRLARAAGLDPAEVRRRNFIGREQFPYESVAGYTYDSGDYLGALDTLLEVADYPGLRRRQEELRRAGRHLGIGLAVYVEVCGFESWEAGRVWVQRDGSVRASAGTLDQGQGHRTSFVQVVAGVLGLSPEQVELVQGDTATSPYGFGTSGSRSAAHGGSAVYGAARRVADKAVRIAAHLLEAAPDDLVLADGRIEVRGSPGIGVSWQEVVDAAHDGDLPDGEQPGLDEQHRFESGGRMFPFGAHLAMVEVDPDSGVVTLESIWAVDDFGRVINPMLADGQRHGGLAQGIGQALWEGVVYDQDGNLVTSTLVDYLLPTAGQLPIFQLENTVTPSPHNPLGVKGVGEAGTIGSTAAVVNAVVDALAPFGVEHLDVPLRPEKVWRAMHGGACEHWAELNRGGTAKP